MKIKYWGAKEQDFRKGGMNRNKNWRGDEIYQEAKIASFKIKRTEKNPHSIFKSYNMKNEQITWLHSNFISELKKYITFILNNEICLQNLLILNTYT